MIQSQIIDRCTAHFGRNTNLGLRIWMKGCRETAARGPIPCYKIQLSETPWLGHRFKKGWHCGHCSSEVGLNVTRLVTNWTNFSLEALVPGPKSTNDISLRLSE